VEEDDGDRVVEDTLAEQEGVQKGVAMKLGRPEEGRDGGRDGEREREREGGKDGG